jgi:clathrin heavy chain
VKFGLTSLESDKFIVSVETKPEGPQIAIVDLLAGNAITRQKMKAEAAIMNPVSKVIALRGKRHHWLHFILSQG